jgi:hypothetical protein
MLRVPCQIFAPADLFVGIPEAVGLLTHQQCLMWNDNPLSTSNRFFIPRSLSNSDLIGEEFPLLLFKGGNCQSAKAITQFITQSRFSWLTH